MLRILAIFATCALVMAGSARADTRVTSAGATVTFPVERPKYGRPQPGRHGETWATLFALTFDKTEVRDERDLDALVLALKSAEQWNAQLPATGELFSFTTMAFPNSLAAILWDDRCRPPSTDRQNYECRAIEVDGVSGREYLARTRDPAGSRSYFAQQVVVRNDRLYLLSYLAEDGAPTLEEGRPSTPRQRAFLSSLRFDGP